MGLKLFRDYHLEEEHKIALEVIESDRRTKTQFELHMKNFNMERIIATLIALVVAYVIFFIILPDQRKNELDRSQQGKPTQEQVGK